MLLMISSIKDRCSYLYESSGIFVLRGVGWGRGADVPLMLFFTGKFLLGSGNLGARKYMEKKKMKIVKVRSMSENKWGKKGI